MFLLIVVAAACGTEATPSDRPSVGNGASSEGSPAITIDGDWLLIAATIDDSALSLVPDYAVTLTIAGTEIGGRAACNGYGGSAVIDGDAFSVGEITMTLMGCVQPVMNLESAYLMALGRVTTATVTDGTLRLAGDGTELDFKVIPPVPTSELLNTVWLLDTIIRGDTASSTLAAADDATLLLLADGTFTGETGCRAISGHYVIAGGAVQLTSFAAEGDCPADIVPQDGDVISVLEGPFTVEITGDRLTLTAPGGEALSYRSRG